MGISSCVQGTKLQKGKFAVYVTKTRYLHTYYTDKITFENNTIFFESIGDNNKIIRLEGNYSIETLE
jgi:hypothetical protein